MDIAEITKEAGRDRRRKRIGRGNASGQGGTAGRGHKGAGSRSGSRRQAMKEGGQMPAFRRMPKRGFSNARFRTVYSVVNVEDLEARFETGDHVTPTALVQAGLIRDVRHPVKVLGQGELKKKLTVDAAKYSKQAEEKIKAVGGEARVI
ncbi:MAG: 50S ribosomal protein L15 [Phycisphaerales bacterium]|nr:MAG: 50S ribosomal protein L15 [Phycisphaerales bacterium]